MTALEWYKNNYKETVNIEELLLDEFEIIKQKLENEDKLCGLKNQNMRV